jgi:hypothetical protein
MWTRLAFLKSENVGLRRGGDPGTFTPSIAEEAEKPQGFNPFRVGKYFING